MSVQTQHVSNAAVRHSMPYNMQSSWAQTALVKFKFCGRKWWQSCGRWACHITFCFACFQLTLKAWKQGIDFYVMTNCRAKKISVWPVQLPLLVGLKNAVAIHQFHCKYNFKVLWLKKIICLRYLVSARSKLQSPQNVCPNFGGLTQLRFRLCFAERRGPGPCTFCVEPSNG